MTYRDRLQRWNQWRLERGHAAFIIFMRRHGIFAYASLLGFILAFGTLARSEYLRQVDERARLEQLRLLRISQSWQLINTARGGRGDGGRGKALEYLFRQGETLDGLDMSHAWINNLNLSEYADDIGRVKRASMQKAWLTGVHFEYADLKGIFAKEARVDSAHLNKAELTNANFYEADLRKTDLREANLIDANLIGAKLDSAVLDSVVLKGAKLWWTHLKGASMRGIQMEGAELDFADLEGADLTHADLAHIRGWLRIKSLRLANLFSVQFAPSGFLEWALSDSIGAVSIKDRKVWVGYKDSIYTAKQK